MITASVRDFQSIGHATLQIEGLTVIVGPSDRGKSALLRAIDAALFNRAGDQFVRKGQKAADVALTLAGTDVHEIRWTKGKKGSGVNQFSVDGEDYSKVGKGVPEVLQTIGFRDVLIGARLKDDGKLEGGKLIRPQVARQFDPIYLLDESGAFLNEVLIGLSRLATLQRATRLCGADLRTAKSEHKARQTDRDRAVARRDALAPIVELSARVEGLTAEAASLDQLKTTIVELRARRILRRAALQVLAHPLPAQRASDPLPAALIDRWWNHLMPLVAARRQALRQLAHPLPTPERPGIDLPVVALRALVAERRRLLGLAALPAARATDMGSAQVMARWTALQPLTVQRRQQVKYLGQAEGELARADADRTALDYQMAVLKHENPMCPTCGQPWGAVDA